MKSKKKSDQQIPFIGGSHRMSWKELVEADDYATSLIVDPFLGFETHKMTGLRLWMSPRTTNRLKNIIIEFQKHKNYLLTYKQLINENVSIKPHWKTDSRFRDHIFRYLLLFDDSSGVKILPCSRYASEGHMGGAIFSTKIWPKGSRIYSLIGCIAELDFEDEVSFLRYKENDFSVMYSSRKKKSQLWLGPAAYVNHDCQPNCAFTINCDGDDRMSLTATTDIKSGDEIYIYYDKHFFGPSNANCECFTCELLEKGSFSSSQGISTAEVPILPKDNFSLSTASSMHSLSLPPSKFVEKPARIPTEDGLVVAIKERLKQSPVIQTAARPNLRSRRSASTDTLPTPSKSPAADAINGVLLKGISRGLAQKAVNTTYGLRHTYSRLTRVKAKIYSTMRSSLNQSHHLHQRETHKVGFGPRSRRWAPPTTAHPSTPTKMPLKGDLQPMQIDLVKKRRWSRRAATAKTVAATPEGVDVSFHNSSMPVCLSSRIFLPQVPSSSSSPASTIAATEADEALAMQIHCPSRSRLMDDCCGTTPPDSVYFFRHPTRSKSPSEPIIIDLSVDSDSSTCSSPSTCPAVSATPSLTFRKRTFQKNEDLQDVWFVKNNVDDSDFETDSMPPPTPPILHTSRGGERGTTSAASITNTPSPPHLQAVSPNPPILQQSENQMLFNVYPPTVAEAASVLELDRISESRNSASLVKPLMIRIKRMEQRLYCLSPKSISTNNQ